MTSRERVLTTLNFKEPDRVPIDLGGTWVSTISVRAYEELKKYLGVEVEKTKIEDIDIIGQCVRKLDEVVLEKLGVDFRPVYLKFPGKEFEIIEDKDSHHHKDEWGIWWRMPKKCGFYYDMIDHPLKEATVKDLTKYPWPFPRKDGLWRERLIALQEEAKDLYEEGNYAVVANISEPGLFERAWFLRGMENFMIDIISNQDFAETILDKILGIHLWLYEQYLDFIGQYIQVVTLGDDIAGQRGPLISPQLYRRLIKPRHKELIDLIKKKTKAKIFYHCCGSINEFLKDLIEIGVDIVNPVQISAKDMDTSELKKKYGHDIVFWGGGCDTQEILPFGKPIDVEREVRKRINDLASGGGFVFTQVHEIQANTPPENIMAMFRAAKNYGKYPI